MTSAELGEGKEGKRELDVLLDFSLGLSSRLELEDVLSQVISLVHRVTQGDSCFLYLLDEERQELVLKASWKPHPKDINVIRLRVGEGLTGWVAQQRQVVAIGQNAYLDSRFKQFLNLPEDRFEAFLSVPLMVKERVVGVINVQHRRAQSYPANVIKIMQIIGQQVGIVIENSQLTCEVKAVRSALELRKLLARAKGILQSQCKLTEEEAYLRIQRQSRKTRRPIKEIAEAIVIAAQIK